MDVKKIKERMVQIRGYAITLTNSVRSLAERRSVLEPLIENAELKMALEAKLNGTIGVRAFNHLAPMMYLDLVRDLARIILDSHNKVCSLSNLYRKASETNLLAEIRKDFREIPDAWCKSPISVSKAPKEIPAEDLKQMREHFLLQIRDDDRDRFEKDFNDTWERIGQAILELESDPVAEKIKNFRDKHLVHLEMPPLGQDPRPFDIASLGLTILDTLDFEDRYGGVALELSRVITGQSWDIDDQREINRKCGEDMWAAFAGLKRDYAASSSDSLRNA